MESQHSEDKVQDAGQQPGSQHGAASSPPKVSWQLSARSREARTKTLARFAAVPGGFFLIGLSLVMLGGGLSAYYGHASKSWPQTEGEILWASSDVTRHTSYDHKRRPTGHTLSGEMGLSYTYRVPTKEPGKEVLSEAKVYRGNLYWFGGAVTNLHYLTGTKLTVYYNPANPEMAVLEPGFHPSPLREGVIKIGVVFLFFGAVVVALYIHKRKLLVQLLEQEMVAAERLDKRAASAGSFRGGHAKSGPVS